MNETTFVQHFQAKRVSVYQNGIAFFHKRGQVDASNGRVELDELPIGMSAQKDKTGPVQVLFGTVQFSSPANPLLRITVFTEGVETQAPSTSLSEILSHNLDKSIQFTLKKDPLPYSGKIVSVQDGALLIKMDKGWKQIAVEAIDYLDFTESPNLFCKKVFPKTNIHLDFEHRQKSMPLDLLYFQKGLSWVPNYHFELLGDQIARLSLKANVFNDAEDLNEVAVNFVMGIPSFANIRDPLFSGQSQEDFLDDLESPPRYRPPRYSAPMERERGSMNYSTSDDSAQDGPDTANNLSNEDQFFYTKEELSLPKGGRMLIHLLETDISYEDHYSTQLTPGYNRSRTKKLHSNTVWHSLKFRNESGLPLPSGSVTFIKNKNGEMSPISQNELSFVPADLMASVKMTQVPDISVFDQETDTDVKSQEHKNRTVVNVEAIIEVSNFKKKKITLEIRRKIVGELLGSDFPWTKSYPEAENALNQSNEVSWLLALKPGEHKKITYSYQFFAR
jgi:hypothetical protein